MNFSKGKMSIAISWCILAYFLILFAERVQSLARIGAKNFFAVDGFHHFVNGLAILSIVVSVVLLAVANKDFWKSLVDGAVLPDYSILTVTVGVMLVSGMLHTEFTIAPIQFGSYGLLILGMILRTAQNTAGGTDVFKNWYSLAFLTVFSMAIPVMYPSNMEKTTFFYIVEAVTALALVAGFTVMLRMLFLGQGADLLCFLPMIVAIIGDALILALRWKESVNTFVLIFIILSAVLFAVGRILFAIIK